jgi:hypothetical protein
MTVHLRPGLVLAIFKYIYIRPNTMCIIYFIRTTSLAMAEIIWRWWKVRHYKKCHGDP